jgi:hypothetical protein
MSEPGYLPTTWEKVHAGDVVLGHDEQAWGVVDIALGDPRGPIVTLYRYGQTLGPAQPPTGTPIIVVSPVDTAPEAQAFAALADAGLAPEVIRESITP